MTGTSSRIGDPALAARLRKELQGEVLFEPFDRGRYSTDASIYQIEPIGVVVPRTADDVVRAIQIAAEEHVPVVPRGAGTSQSGQAIGQALIVDTSKYLTRILGFDAASESVRLQPGVVLDHLNDYLRPHGVFFPVDPATASQATLGGMAGNNSAGARSIRYGLMADHVRRIHAVLADGAAHEFGPVPAALDQLPAGATDRYRRIVRDVRALYLREQDEIAARVPKVLRHVAGYNLHRIGTGGHNMAELLVGSEGTLAFFTELELSVAPRPAHTTLGVCHFHSLHAAMDATQHIVTLGPVAVELVDHTLLGLARDHAVFARAAGRFVRGEPRALLLVEFAGDDEAALRRQLDRLENLMGDLGLAKAVVRAEDPAFQRQVWSVRKAGLSIVMSMRGDRKPVSFIEDCAVPLEHLAEYTSRIEEIFRRHGTAGTWYAHASVGCLHVRPALNLKQELDVATLRTIAEQAHAVVREYKGSHSGEHGDGIVRSEFLEPMLGRRMARAFAEVKRMFDPDGRLNPGKIVDPPRMDDRSLFRYKPDYEVAGVDTVLDWSEWGGLLPAVEMCNNNGACRKRAPDVMCPSYRVTGDEQHTTRGRANTLRLALTGQLGAEALTSDAMYDAFDLCISCKACRRECPTGVDMARMKIEFLHRYRGKHGVPLKDRLVAYLPRYAPFAARVPWLFNARNRVPGLRRVAELLTGISARRELPAWRRDVWRDGRANGSRVERDVVVFVDTFTRYFEPENAHAAMRVLRAAGYHPRPATPAGGGGGRPLCCGRTFLNTGLVDEARVEARRVIAALDRFAERDEPIVGLEPSCLLTLRDELPALVPGDATRRLARRAMLLEEFLVAERDAGRLQLPLGALGDDATAWVHGHCHQKAFAAMDAVHAVLSWVPGLTVQPIESSCCGMAGSFGYDAAHYDVSQRMAELALLPAVRAAPPGAWIVADGTSCRRQIADGSGRGAVHVVQLLEQALRLASPELQSATSTLQ